MIHDELIPDRGGVPVTVAQKALSIARGLSTARPGYMYIPNKDGTGTWIGGGVGGGGITPWIGDTTPPGRPTGCSCTSAWGTVYCKWAGTLEGGVPADFAYVEVSSGGRVLGRLTEAGMVAEDGFEGGDQVEVSFVAYDAARDSLGNLAPNASEPTVVSVTVTDERDEIDAAVKDANDRADALQGEIKDVKVDVSDLSTKVTGAVEQAGQSLTVATEAKQTAESVSTTASRAYEDAQSALTQASSAVQTAQKLQQTVSEEYLSKDEATGSYASKSEVTQTKNEILSEVSESYQSKDGMSSYYTKTEVDQQSDSIKSTVTQVQKAADDAMEKATTVEQTASGLEVTVGKVSQTASNAQSRASTLETLIRASGTGVEVAKKVNGSYTDSRTLMASDSFQVLNKAGSVLAKFAANLVELGRNGIGAVIQMCGGIVRMSASQDAATSYATITANSGDRKNSAVNLVSNGAHSSSLLISGTDASIGNNSGSRGFIRAYASNLIVDNGSVTFELAEKYGNLTLSQATAYDSAFRPRWVSRGGWLQLQGRVAISVGDGVICNIASLMDSRDRPSVNRNFICLGINSSGAVTFDNVYLKSNGDLVSMWAMRMVDLSGVMVRSK